MSWAADLFYAANIPPAQQHDAARLVVLCALLVACLLALAMMLGAVWASEGDRMHLPTRRRVRHDIQSCIRTAKEV